MDFLRSLAKVFSFTQGKTLDPGLRRERSGEFGRHAVRPRSSHHMQVMTVVIWRPPQPLPSFRRRVRQGLRNACVTPAEAVWLASQTVARRGTQRLSLQMKQFRLN